MDIEFIHIKHLRSCEDVIVPFNDYTCLVGPNGVGKSTILCALNIFFREIENASTDLIKLDQEDFYQRDTTKPIEITLTFKNLNEEAQQDFSDYYRQDRLTITAAAVYNEASQCAEVRQYGQRLVMEEFGSFFKSLSDGAKVADLKQIYQELRQSHADLPSPGTKDAMFGALREYEKAHPQLCTLLPSEDSFYGITKGADRLAKYIVWFFMPAMKDAITERIETRNSGLGKLLARTVRSSADFDTTMQALRTDTQQRYETLLKENQHHLSKLSTSLQNRLTEWAHPEATLKLEWTRDPSKSVRIEEPMAQILTGEGVFEGNLARSGHGLQRSYLFALLEELASNEAASAPKLILGCEEPELFQHPPQAQHLASILKNLSTKNSQVIVCSHSPYFVAGKSFEDVRVITKDGSRKTIASFVTHKQISEELAATKGETPKSVSGTFARINQLLQPALNEMFFTRHLILVEGYEDIAYIVSYLNLLNLWDEYRRHGCHMVPTQKKSLMLQPLILAKNLKIPTLAIFDGDVPLPDKNGSKAMHTKDNKALLASLNTASLDPMPTQAIWEQGLVMWHSNIGETVASEIGADKWKDFQSEADKFYGFAGDMAKNSLHIAACLNLAWEANLTSPSLIGLCKKIIDPLDRAWT